MTARGQHRTLCAVLRPFAIPADDRPVLAALAPLFGMITAATMVSMTYARALFVAHHPYDELPLMFIVAAGFTALTTLVYLPLMKRWQLVARFRALLAVSAGSFVLLSFASGAAPGPLGTITFAWTAGVSQLLVLQVWSYSTWLLPIRRARHLFPLLAAAATTGAMIGGGISMVVPSAALLGVAALLLLSAWVLVGRASSRLAEAKLGPGTDAAARPLYSRGSTGGLRGAWNALTKTPLLRQLALLAVALQVGSLCLDVQLSAAAKSTYDADDLAMFFGAYYAIANGVTLGLSLWGAERLSQHIGLGWVAALPAWPLLIGAAVTMIGSQLGAEALLVWVVVVTSLSERIVTFGAARQAFGAAMTPVDARESERARFLIDGVLVRGATALSSAVLLFGDIDLSQWASLAPAIFVAALAALLLVRNVGAAYRQALMDGLEPDQLSTIDSDDVRRWASKDAASSLRALLCSDDRIVVGEGLRRCTVLGIAPPPDLVASMLSKEATSGPELVGDIPTLVLQTLADLGTQVEPELLRASLHPDASTSRQRAALLVASKSVDLELLKAEFHALRGHHDPLVRSLSCALYGDPPEVYADTFRQVLRRLLTGYTTPIRRTAMEAALTLAALRSDALIDPLLDALHSPSLTPAAYTALRRLSPEPVGAGIRTRLGDATRSLSERIRLLRLAELIGMADAIMPALEQDDAGLRDRAIEALWRLTRRGMIPSTPREVVADIARREVALLLRCASIDRGLAEVKGDRLNLVRSEIALRRTRNEQRVFRLLGLVYGRESMDRAFKHYRSPYDRSRSNAIELLDATVGQSELQPLIAYIEATEHQQGRAFTREAAKIDRPESMAAALTDVDPMLGRMYAWGRDERSDDDSVVAAVTHAQDEGFRRQMDRVLLLSRISLFAETPAEELLVVAEVCKPAAYSAGEVIFRPGDPAEKLYLIERGEVEILRDKRRVVQFSGRQAFGELAIVGDSERNTTARAITDVDCLVLARSDFSALLDVSPSLAKGAITVLAQRLRQTLERLG